MKPIIYIKMPDANKADVKRMCRMMEKAKGKGRFEGYDYVIVGGSMEMSLLEGEIISKAHELAQSILEQSKKI